jgi:parvulin-like peptidyl-prolyl isomerase
MHWKPRVSSRPAACIALAAAALLAAPFLAAAGDDGELARVYGEVISEADLTHYLALFELETGSPMPEGLSPLEQEELDAQKRRTGLQALVERRLLAQAARGDYVTEPQMDEALRQLGEEAFREFVHEQGSLVRASETLAEVGCSADDYRDYQIEAILIGQYLREKVYSTLRVSPAEVRAYYEEHESEFMLPRQVVFRQILFVVTEEDEQEFARRAAEDALDRLGRGADFGDLADTLSADRGDWPGGLHRVLIPEEAGDWLPPVVAGLEPGQTSDVRPVAGGLAVARLEQVIPAGPLTFEQVQGTIKDGLLRRKRNAALAECIRRLKREGAVEYLPAASAYGYEPTAPAGDTEAEDG